MRTFESHWKESLPMIGVLASQVTTRRESAEDLVQDTAVIAIERFGSWSEDRCSFGAFASQCLISACESSLGRADHLDEAVHFYDLKTLQ